MILSSYSGTPPEEGEDRKISVGPLYPHIIDIIGKCSVNSWTRKCATDLRNMSFDHDDVRAWIVRAVREGRYHGSEWCQGPKAGVWAACDAYVVTDDGWNEDAGKYFPCDYYIKFFINKNDTVVMTVSFHLST